MRELFRATVAIGLLSGAMDASAADMPVKAPVVPPVIYDWTGPFIGGGVSYSWGRVRDNGTYFPGFYSSTATAPIPGAVTTTRPINHNIRGSDLEIQAGYRRQSGTFVFGIEGIVRWTNQRGTGTCLESYPTGYPLTNGATTATAGNAAGNFMCYKYTRLNSTEAVLLQAGVLAAPNLLLQLSGGPALGQIKNVDTFAFAYTATPGSFSGSSSGTTNKGGYWVGAGAEYALPRSPWHIKLEYAYMNFGNVNTTTAWTDTASATSCIPATSPTRCVHTFTNGRRVSDNSVLIGLNYAFGGPAVAPAPIYTKY